MRPKRDEDTVLFLRTRRNAERIANSGERSWGIIGPSNGNNNARRIIDTRAVEGNAVLWKCAVLSRRINSPFSRTWIWMSKVTELSLERKTPPRSPIVVIRGKREKKKEEIMQPLHTRDIGSHARTHAGEGIISRWITIKKTEKRVKKRVKKEHARINRDGRYERFVFGCEWAMKSSAIYPQVCEKSAYVHAYANASYKKNLSSTMRSLLFHHCFPDFVTLHMVVVAQFI